MEETVLMLHLLAEMIVSDGVQKTNMGTEANDFGYNAIPVDGPFCQN